MSPATRAAFEAHIERKREEYVSLLLEARRLDAEQPDDAHPYAYLLAWNAYVEYRRTEDMVDSFCEEFTRRRSVTIPATAT